MMVDGENTHLITIGDLNQKAIYQSAETAIVSMQLRKLVTTENKPGTFPCNTEIHQTKFAQGQCSSYNVLISVEIMLMHGYHTMFAFAQ